MSNRENKSNPEPAESPVLAILAYHKIGRPSPGAWETWYYVPEETFARQLEYLRRAGWDVIDVAAFLRGLDRPHTLPRRAALITFDDGYRNIWSCALPRLVEFDFPGVIFVPTQYVGRTSAFDANTREPEEPVCSWAELRELERSGVSVQSHGVSHRTFSQLSPQELEQELLQSRRAVEDGVGKPVEVLAYPYGDGGADPAAVRAALERTGYRAACLYEGGPVRLPVENPYRLERLTMWPDTDLGRDLGESVRTADPTQ
jgi:peptidoglycan/xylan/chitin deacetylase (PgdA/CDA1 family)